MKTIKIIRIAFVFTFLLLSRSSMSKDNQPIDTIAVFCSLSNTYSLDSCVDNLQLFLQKKNITCISHTVDNTGATDIYELANILHSHINDIKKQHPDAVIGVVAVGEATVPAMIVCADNPQDFLITFDGVYENGDNYLYDKFMFANGFDGSSEAIAQRADLYDAIQSVKSNIKKNKMSKNVKGVIKKLRLDTSYTSSIISFTPQPLIEKITTPLLALFRQSPTMINGIQYSITIQMAMGRRENDKYRTVVVPTFESKNDIQNYINFIVHDYIINKSNTLTKEMLGKIINK